MIADVSAEDVLEFWFSPAAQRQWFVVSENFDREIERRFKDIHDIATVGRLMAWEESSREALALVILLDQCTRNLYRGGVGMYLNDLRACHIASEAIAKGFDSEVEDWHRAFFYMPFMHSESLEHQDIAVAKFSESGLDNTRYAIHHREIIRRFGRFPHRNVMLGRESTKEELEWLASDEAFTG